MNIAQTFLERFKGAAQDGDVLGLMADDQGGFGAALNGQTAAFAETLAGAVSGERGAPVTLNDDCFATAACDAQGSLICASARFNDWFDGFDLFNSAVRNIRTTPTQVSLFTDDILGRPVALAATEARISRHWPLHEQVRAAIDGGRARYAVAAFRPADHALVEAARAYRLTPAEADLCKALVRQGDLKRAAKERGIAYETARKVIASVMRKTGSKRQTDLVRTVMMLAGGDISASQNLAAVLCDLFSMTRRQAELCVLVADGSTREAAAQLLGISAQRAKAELKVAYQACNVASAVDLSRIVSEVDALKGLANACEVTVRPGGRDAEPLLLIPRQWAEGRIAVADHGPETATPLLLFHTTMGGRFWGKPFIAALQSAGYRPISIERSGYGLSDYVPGDPVETALRDTHEVLDALGLESAQVIARCTISSLIACAGIAHGRFSGGVMLWPDPPNRSDRPRTRMTDFARQIYTEFPAMGHNFARILVNRTSDQHIEKLWRRASEGIAVDLELLNDPDFCADTVRGTRQVVQGFEGFLAEALALGDGPNPRPVTSAIGWTVLVGEGYEKYDSSDAMRFWGDALPGAAVRQVQRGVHFLHATNTADILAALKS